MCGLVVSMDCCFKLIKRQERNKSPFLEQMEDVSTTSSSSSWQCPVCTLHNDASILVCNACQQERPLPTIPPEHGDSELHAAADTTESIRKLKDDQRFVEAMSRKSDTFDPLHITSFGVSSAQEARLCRLPATQEVGYDLTINEYNTLREQRKVRLPLVTGDTVKHEEEYDDLIGTVVSSTIQEDSTETVQVRYNGDDDSECSETYDYTEDAYGDDAFPFEIVSLARRHPEEVWLRNDTSTTAAWCRETSPIVKKERICCICLESCPSSEILSSLCRSTPLCGGEYCNDCFVRYVEASIADQRYSTVAIKCPNATCGRRIPMEAWHGFASKVSLLHYVHTPRQIVTLRCPGCDAISEDLFPRLCTGATDRKAIYERVFESLEESRNRCDVMMELVKAWRLFSCDRATPQETIEKFHQVLQPPDSFAFTKLLLGSKSRFNEDSAAEMEDGLLSLVVDVERRASLTLALLRAYPVVEMPCCDTEACFQCKTESHEGETCEERQKEQIGCCEGAAVQSCPRCGVPTMRSEGCSHIVCVCGGHWEWNEEEEE